MSITLPVVCHLCYAYMRVVHDTKGYFPESLQANTGILLKLDFYHFPANRFKLVVYKPSYDFGFLV